MNLKTTITPAAAAVRPQKPEMPDEAQAEHTPELLEALNFAVAVLTQPVQFTGIRNGASCDVLRFDAATVVAHARSAIARATGKEVA